MNRLKLYMVMAMTMIITLVKAQGDEVWTLDRCISHALENNIDMKIQRNTEQYYSYTRKQSQWSLLPSISGSGSSNLSLRRSTDQNNDITSGSSYNVNYGVSASFNVFSGFTALNTISAARFYEMACGEASDATANELITSIVTLYSQVLYQKAIADVLDERLKVSVSESERIAANIMVGKLESVAQNEIDATVSGNKLELSKAQNNFNLYRLQLLQLIEIDTDTNFIVSNSEFDVIEPMIYGESADVVYAMACSGYPSVLQKEFELDYYRKLLQIAKGELAPSISLNGSYGSGFYSTDTLASGKQTPFGTQFEDYLSPSLGISISIPILNGLYRNFNVKKSRIEMENAVFELENQKKQIRKEIENAIFQANAFCLEYKSAVDNLKFVEKSFETYREKYRLGLINATDFISAQNQLSQAQADVTRARYSWIVQTKTIELYKGVQPGKYNETDMEQ